MKQGRDMLSLTVFYSPSAYMCRTYSRKTGVEEGVLSGPLQWYEDVGSLDQSDTSGERGSRGFRMASRESTELERGLQNRGRSTDFSYKKPDGKYCSFMGSTICHCHSTLSL